MVLSAHAGASGMQKPDTAAVSGRSNLPSGRMEVKAAAHSDEIKAVTGHDAIRFDLFALLPSHNIDSVIKT